MSGDVYDYGHPFTLHALKRSGLGSFSRITATSNETINSDFGITLNDAFVLEEPDACESSVLFETDGWMM